MEEKTLFKLARTVGDGYLDVKINYSENTGSSRSTTLTFDQDGSGNKINLTVTQKPQKASTFTLSGLPTGTGYYLFGRGARPQNTSSSGQVYILNQVLPGYQRGHL